MSFLPSENDTLRILIAYEWREREICFPDILNNGVIGELAGDLFVGGGELTTGESLIGESDSE